MGTPKENGLTCELPFIVLCVYRCTFDVDHLACGRFAPEPNAAAGNGRGEVWFGATNEEGRSGPRGCTTSLSCAFESDKSLLKPLCLPAFLGQVAVMFPGTLPVFS